MKYGRSSEGLQADVDSVLSADGYRRGVMVQVAPPTPEAAKGLLTVCG